MCLLSGILRGRAAARVFDVLCCHAVSLRCLACRATLYLQAGLSVQGCVAGPAPHPWPPVVVCSLPDSVALRVSRMSMRSTAFPTLWLIQG